MSFASKIKKELLSKKFSHNNAQAFVVGIMDCIGEKSENTSNISICLNDKNNLMIIFRIINELGMKSSFDGKKIIVMNFKRWKNVKLSTFYFIGLFVAGGSISNFNSTSYHLDFSIKNIVKANLIKKLLNKHNFEFKLFDRNNKWILYIKKVESISDFLKVIQAYDALFVFEEFRIKRNHLNQLNKYSDFDIYNQKKQIDAHKLFLRNYNLITKKNLLKKFNEDQQLFFKLKKQHSFSSLRELVKIMEKHNVIKTKSALNHYLIKLKKISNM